MSVCLQSWGFAGLDGLDTGKVTLIIRDRGSRLGLITAADTETARGVERIRAYRVPHDAVARVSTK